MTDIELLKLAAKAVGIEFEWHPGCGDALHLTAKDAGAIYWNPLTDDGDALRLATKLFMIIEINDWGAVAATDPGETIYMYADGQSVGVPVGDTGAAIRRAIVRAAAEIGLAAECGAA